MKQWPESGILKTEIIEGTYVSVIATLIPRK